MNHQQVNRAAHDGRPRPIRTLLFSTLFPSAARPEHGIFVETRLRELLSSGQVRTRVVAPVPWFPSSSPRYGRWAQWAAVPRQESRDGIEVVHPRYALPPKIGMNVAPWLLALGARPAIRRLVANGGDFDLIDAHYFYPDGAAAALLARWFRRPFVVTGRGTDLNLLPEFPIPRRWVRWTARRAAASIVVSEALKRRLLALGVSPEDIHVLRNGVDPERFELQDRGLCRAGLGVPDGPLIVSVGNFYRFKGHDLVIESLRSLPDGVSLAIVGDGEERSRLEALIAKLGLQSRVRLVGIVPQNQLVRWYNAADVLVLASSREGSPNVVLEALACGLRVVATSVGGIPEIVRSTTAGLLVERDPPAIAAAIREILANPVNREAVRGCVADLTWAETTRRQIELFRSVINERVDS